MSTHGDICGDIISVQKFTHPCVLFDRSNCEMYFVLRFLREEQVLVVAAGDVAAVVGVSIPAPGVLWP